MDTVYYEVKNPTNVDCSFVYLGVKYSVTAGDSIKNVPEVVAEKWVNETHQFLKKSKMPKSNTTKQEVVEEVKEEVESIKEEIKEVEEVVDTKEIVEEVKEEVVKTSKK